MRFLVESNVIFLFKFDSILIVLRFSWYFTP